MSEQQKLNLGCGNDIRDGWINLDSAKLPGVNIVHDLEDLPLPFGDENFDYVLCQDVLEHVNSDPAGHPPNYENSGDIARPCPTFHFCECLWRSYPQTFFWS